MSAQPTRIRRRDPSKLVIEWSDGETTTFSAAELRRLCPCATCVSETTGQRLLDPASIPDELTQEDVRLVGNYALCPRFSDGHDTGIFSYAFLRTASRAD